MRREGAGDNSSIITILSSACPASTGLTFSVFWLWGWGVRGGGEVQTFRSMLPVRPRLPERNCGFSCSGFGSDLGGSAVGGGD